MANLLRHAVRRLRPPDRGLAAAPAMEDSYRHLFLRELERLGERDIYFPVGGAANYSLLYVILMTALRCQPGAVLDVGCGQTTLLWDRLRARGLVRAVATLENDEYWAETMANRVGHPILVSPLRPVAVGALTLKTYDWSLARPFGPFDMIVVDGPRGESRDSRGGVLQLIDENLPSDFAIVLDDVERRGEQDTVTAIHDRLQALGRPYFAGVVRAATTQCVFAGGRYTAAAFL